MRENMHSPINSQVMINFIYWPGKQAQCDKRLDTLKFILREVPRNGGGINLITHWHMSTKLLNIQPCQVSNPFFLRKSKISLSHDRILLIHDIQVACEGRVTPPKSSDRAL